MNTSFIVGNRWLSFAPHILWRLTPQLFMKMRVKCSLMFNHLDKQTTSSQQWQTCLLFISKSAVSTQAPTFVCLSLSLKNPEITHAAFANTSNVPSTVADGQSQWNVTNVYRCGLVSSSVQPSFTDQEAVVRRVKTDYMFYTSARKDDWHLAVCNTRDVILGWEMAMKIWFESGGSWPDETS